MKSIINTSVLILAGTLICTSLFACAGTPGKTLISDDTGAQIKIDHMPNKIISLAPSNTEIIYALELDDRLVGVTEFCNYPPDALNKARVGGFSTVDIEKVISLQPDLVLTTDIHNKSVSPMLQKLGFIVVTLNPKTVQAVMQDIDLVGKITGKERVSAAIVRDMQSHVDSITSTTRTIAPGEKPRTLLIIWHDPIMVVGNNNLIHDLIQIAGGNNIASDINGFQSIGLETIISRDPQVIIIPTAMNKKESPLLSYITSDPRFKGTSALKNNRVDTMDGDLVYRYSPRCIAALDQIVSFLRTGGQNKGTQ